MFNIFYDINIGKTKSYFFHRFFPNKAFLEERVEKAFLPYYFQLDKINNFDMLFFGSSMVYKGISIPQHLQHKVMKIAGDGMSFNAYPDLYKELLPKINIKTYEILPVNVSMYRGKAYYKSSFLKNMFLFFNYLHISAYKTFFFGSSKLKDSRKDKVPFVWSLYRKPDAPYDYAISLDEFFVRERVLNIKEAFTQPETHEMFFYYDLERLYFLFRIYSSFRSFYMYEYPGIKTRKAYKDSIHFKTILGKEYIKFYEHGYSKYFTKVTKENLDSFFTKKYKRSLKNIPTMYGRKNFNYTWTKAFSINEKFFTKDKINLLNRVTSNHHIKFDDAKAKSFDLGKLKIAQYGQFYMLSIYGDFKKAKTSFFVKKAGGKKILLTSFDKPLQRDLNLYLPNKYKGYNLIMEVKPFGITNVLIKYIDIRRIKKNFSFPKIDQINIDFYTQKSKLLMEGGSESFYKFHHTMYDKYSNSMLTNTKKQKLFFSIPKYSKNKEYMVHFSIKGGFFNKNIILKSNYLRTKKAISNVFKGHFSGYNIYFNIPKNSSKNGNFYFEISAKNHYKPTIELKEKLNNDI